jgi:hypothetical protein
MLKIDHTHSLKLRKIMLTGGVAVTLYIRIMEFSVRISFRTPDSLIGFT